MGKLFFTQMAVACRNTEQPTDFVYINAGNGLRRRLTELWRNWCYTAFPLNRMRAYNLRRSPSERVWSEVSVGLWRACIPVAKTARNSTSVDLGSAVSLRE